MRRVLLLMVAALIAAGSPIWAKGSTEAAKPAQKVELKAIWWGSQARHEGTIKTIELYQQKNPNVTMVYEFANWNDYWTKVTTMAAGGQLPDVMQQDYAYVAEWNKRNLLHGLDEYVQSKVLDFSNVSDSLISSGRIDNKLYAVNLGSNSQTMMLDKDAFEKAGVALPKSDWSWEDFEKIALELHEKLGIYGHGSGLDNNQLWKNVYISLGQGAYAADGKSTGYTDDKPFADFLTMVQRLIKAGAVPTKQESIATWGDGDNPEQWPIIQKKAAMQSMWSNQAFAVDKASGAGRHFVLMSIPRTKKGAASPNYIKASQFFSVSNQSKVPQEAAKFINYITNDVDANKILLAERGVPISSAIREALAPLVPPITQEVFNYVGWVAKEASPCPPPDPVKHNEIVNNIYKPQVVEQVFFGKITPEEGAKLLRTKANELLATIK